MIEPVSTFELKQLTIEVMTASDVEVISRCKVSHQLRIERWPRIDLTELAKLAPRDLTMAGGVLASAAGCEANAYELVMMMGLPRLESLAGLDTKKLWVDGCARLNLDTLSRVTRLKFASFVDMEVESLEFVRGCADLEALSCGAVASGVDLAPIAESQSLRRVRLNGVPDEQIRKTGLASPQLAISNDRVAFQGGQPMDLQAFNRSPV